MLLKETIEANKLMPCPLLHELSQFLLVIDWGSIDESQIWQENLFCGVEHLIDTPDRIYLINLPKDIIQL